MARTTSVKYLQIDKSNATMITLIAVASFVAVFSIIASKALLSQRNYQARVISAKKQALNQLKANNTAAEQLKNSYQAFVAPSENIIGGNKTGSGDRDGDNARIVLDALPSKYDFPALATSIQKLLSSRNFTINSINGTDDELNQVNNTDSSQPIEIPFQVSVSGNYQAVQSMIDTLQRSIRPVEVLQLNISGGSTLTVTVSAKTYYQPEQKVEVRTEVIK